MNEGVSGLVRGWANGWFGHIPSDRKGLVPCRGTSLEKFIISKRGTTYRQHIPYLDA
jgi:hypothetical protein